MKLRRVLAVLGALVACGGGCVDVEPMSTVRLALTADQEVCDAYCIKSFYVVVWDADFDNSPIDNDYVTCGAGDVTFNVLAGSRVTVEVQAKQPDSKTALLGYSETITVATHAMDPVFVTLEEVSTSLPEITDVAQKPGDTGVVLAISGANLGDAETGDTYLEVDGKRVETTEWSATSITTEALDILAESSVGIVVVSCGLRSDAASLDIATE